MLKNTKEEVAAKVESTRKRIADKSSQKADDLMGVINNKTDVIKKRVVHDSSQKVNEVIGVVNDKTNEVKKRIEDESINAKENIKQSVEEAKAKAIETAENAARDLTSGLDKLDSEIANHYLDGWKYGMEGQCAVISCFVLPVICCF